MPKVPEPVKPPKPPAPSSPHNSCRRCGIALEALTDEWLNNGFAPTFRWYYEKPEVTAKLVTLKGLLPRSRLDDFKIEEWDDLTEAYIDIIWNLRDFLPPEGGKDTYEQEVSRDMVEIEMHNLCAHFRKTIVEGVTKNPKITGDVSVLCWKKLGDVARAVWGITGHETDKSWVTDWYNKAFEHSPHIENVRSSLVFLTVALEAAKWTWFTDQTVAKEMLDWAVATAVSRLPPNMCAKYQEMKKVQEDFKEPTGEWLKTYPPLSRQITRVFL